MSVKEFYQLPVADSIVMNVYPGLLSQEQAGRATRLPKVLEGMERAMGIQPNAECDEVAEFVRGLSLEWSMV
jgi:hypothetical protein